MIPLLYTELHRYARNTQYNPERLHPVRFPKRQPQQLDSFNAQVATDVSGQMVFRNTKDVLITRCSPPATEVLLRLEDESRLINVIANDLGRVKTPFTFDESTSRSDVYAESNKTQSALVGSLGCR